MDTNSRIFHKAVATLAKQVTPEVASARAWEPLPTTRAERRAFRERVFDLHYGTLFSFIFNRLCLEILISLDVPPELLGDIDRNIIQRARDVVTNATIVEIMEEDPNGPLQYRDVLRHQILALCTRLRVSLAIIDKLMALTNALTGKIDDINDKFDK